MGLGIRSDSVGLSYVLLCQSGRLREVEKGCKYEIFCVNESVVNKSE